MNQLWEKISFLEKPVTKDELQIAKALNNLVEAINTQNLDLLKSVYAGDATIMTSRHSIPLIKTEYLHYMAGSILYIRRFCLKNVLIRVTDSEADVTCTNIIYSRRNLGGDQYHRYFKFTKQNEFWLVLRSRYIE